MKPYNEDYCTKCQDWRDIVERFEDAKIDGPNTWMNVLVTRLECGHTETVDLASTSMGLPS